eukprot:634960-Pleurochrysis_carterae.AAC.1
MSYELSALHAVPWLAEQALENVLVAVHHDEQAGNVKMSWIRYQEAAKRQELLLDTVLRSGTIARRCLYRWKDQAKAFVSTVSGVMNRRHHWMKIPLIQCRDQNGPDAPRILKYSLTVA